MNVQSQTLRDECNVRLLLTIISTSPETAYLENLAPRGIAIIWVGKFEFLGKKSVAVAKSEREISLPGDSNLRIVRKIHLLKETKQHCRYSGKYFSADIFSWTVLTTNKACHRDYNSGLENNGIKKPLYIVEYQK